MPTVFVSAFLNLREDRSKDKSVDTCFQHFSKLADTGIHIHLFLSRSFQGNYEQIRRPNVFVEWIEFEDLDLYKDLRDVKCELPSNRTGHHDTRNFMILMNSKTEFLHRAQTLYGAQYTHYAWIDFSIFHVLRDHSSPYLKMLGSSALKKGLYMPGCWDPINPSFDSVCWRFCGGFFIGDADSIHRFYMAHRSSFVSLVTTKGLAWEVNVWAWLEHGRHIQVNWIKADHNDTIIRVSAALKVVASLTTIPPRAEDCRLTLDSLIHQVDHIYLSVCPSYKRFGSWITPPYLAEEPYKSKVTVVLTEDRGPATKYLGGLSAISTDSWIFVCDDDQEYHPDLISKMVGSIGYVGVYQNHYDSIRQKTSGGLIHGYVGLMVHASLLQGLPGFHLPDAAQFVDDQWMSIYCFKKSIPIFNTGVEAYSDIYRVLDGWHEKIGAESLAALQNRDLMVANLAEEFGVVFNKEALSSAR